VNAKKRLPHFSKVANRIFLHSIESKGTEFMEFFFKPRGVAIIGASANPVKGGHFILKNVMKGFKGGVYPVNPGYEEIEGLPCYPTVGDVPDPVDLAIIFVPGPGVPDIVKMCAERGIKGVMIESAGFAEAGDNGGGLQEELVAVGQETGIRIWGPNCMGLVDAVNRQVFSFVLPAIWEGGLTPGDVSLVVQSGMLSAGFLIDIMSHGTMGISKACSIGNKADVDECDILQYLIDDADTGVIGLYLESIQNGRRFVDLARGSTKPIVVLRGGKSRTGARAAVSHTASLAGNDAVVSGALAQVGVVEANDFKQMMDLCRSVSDYPAISSKGGGRVAILTMSGAAGILSSDFIEPLGLTVADLSDDTVRALMKVFPKWMPVANPVDLWPAIELNGRKKVYRTAFQAVCADPNVDGVLFHSFVGGIASETDISGLAQIARSAGKPLFGWVMGKRDQIHQFRLHTRELGVPVFPELYRAVECMAAVFKRGRYLRRKSL
jgi:acetyltransferase